MSHCAIRFRNAVASWRTVPASASRGAAEFQAAVLSRGFYNKDTLNGEVSLIDLIDPDRSLKGWWVIKNTIFHTRLDNDFSMTHHDLEWQQLENIHEPNFIHQQINCILRVASTPSKLFRIIWDITSTYFNHLARWCDGGPTFTKYPLFLGVWYGQVTTGVPQRRGAKATNPSRWRLRAVATSETTMVVSWWYGGFHKWGYP
jgi:hypothetical protein